MGQDDLRGTSSRQLATLSSLVPSLAVELGDTGGPAWRLIEGSLLSADISGFTALSERLAADGKVGAETITDMVNACFEALMAAAERFGGEVIKFGGDALLVLFRGADHARRAADAAVTMQRALLAEPGARAAALSMTVGVGSGPFDAYLIGTQSRDLILSGPAATTVIALEGAAARGEVLAGRGVWSELPERCVGRVEAGAAVVVDTTGDADVGPRPEPEPTTSIAEHVPAAVAGQLAAFERLGGEHRLVTVGFVQVGGLTDFRDRLGPLALADELTSVLDGVVKAAERYGVTLLHSDIAPDGAKFVLCAGAPVNAGDTADAMLRAALHVAALPSELTIRQGIQTGRVFAGFLGRPTRRAYTLMGDPVNTAARMLGHAGDRDVVAMESVIEQTRTVFATERLEPFKVKGKTDAVVAHRVLDVTARVRRDSAGTRLIGRQRELDVLSRAIGEGGQAVEIVGAAGVGKSRLLDAAWGAAESLMIDQAACTPYGMAVPYGVFRPLLRAAAGIPEAAPAEAAGAVLGDLVSRVCPQLLPMLPLLAAPFGAQVPPTPEADAIDPEYRRVRIHDVVVRFLEEVHVGSVLFLVEDAQWIDDASGDLLHHLVRSCVSRPWTMIVTRRPEGTWRVSEDEDHVVRLVLKPLSEEAIERLAVEVSGRPLGDRELATIAERAQGNPLFAIELARALTETTDEVPDTIEQIIASRLDRLRPAARMLVRVAAVLGNVFDEDHVRLMMEADGPAATADEALLSAADAGAVSRRPGGRWAFNHALYRDTAYAGLPYARRRELHHRAATIIESRAADPAAVAALLSLHYSAAERHEEAWRHSIVAGSHALGQGALAEAAVALERALISAARCPSVSAVERAGVAEQLGDVCYEIGRFDAARSRFRLARREQADEMRRVRLVRKIGSVHERLGRPQRALRCYAHAVRSMPPDALDPSWLDVRADVRLAEAGIRARLGDNETCLRLAEAARADAQAAGVSRTEALAFERAHLALTYLRRPNAAESGTKALDIYRRLGDRPGTARVLINMGIDAYFRSEWTEATAHYLEALETARNGGSVVLAATAAINSAEVLSDQGSWTAALELLDSARRNYEAVGYTAGTAAASLFAAVACTRAGRFDEARDLFDLARSLLVRLGMSDMVDELDTRQLELAVRTGTATVESCTALIERFGGPHPCVPRVLRCQGLVEAVHGDQRAARSTIDRALALAPEGYERALVLLAAALISPDDPDAARWRADAQTTLDRLGVASAPPLQ